MKNDLDLIVDYLDNHYETFYVTESDIVVVLDRLGMNDMSVSYVMNMLQNETPYKIIK